MENQDLENSVFTTAEEDEYNIPLKAEVPPERKRDIDLNNTLYDNIIAAGFSSQLNLNELNSLNSTAENRNQMYNIYDMMCEDGTISAVVETYAEDATERNESGNIVWVEASDDKVSKCVEYFLDTLNVNKNIFKWVYSLCKYGDVYLRLYRQSEYDDELFKPKNKETLNEDILIKAYGKNDNYAHYMEMVANPAEMFELTRFGKTVGYIKATVDGVITRQDSLDFSTFSYKFKKDDLTIYPATEFVHAALEDNVSRSEEEVNIFLNTEDYDTDSNGLTYTVRKGNSLLANVYKIWRELQLLEASVLLNRVTKSSIVRLINVEVGDMPKENVTKTLMGIKQMIEQKAAINTGKSLNEYTNPGPIENNVYVPTHEGIGSITTSQIGGDVDVKSLADLEYYLNKLYGQLRVPKQYFSQTDDSAGFNGGTSLSIISSRYAKMVKRIQNTIIQAITDAINLMLLDKGLDSYVNEFTIHMLPPTTQEEIDRRDNLSSKVQLTSDILNMLSDIEDPTTRLKILKSLIGNIIDNPEIISILQEEIDKMEEQNAEVVEQVDTTTEEEPLQDFNSTFGSGLETTETETTEVEEPEAILPSPEELGVDLNEPEE